jgi:hypothetical protein
MPRGSGGNSISRAFEPTQSVHSAESGVRIFGQQPGFRSETN